MAARIWDNDGDFLLIEAAYSLPKWLKPDTSTNRVWLQSGCLHIIPLPSKHHSTLPAAPTVAEALQIISSGSISTEANSGMQGAIQSRIKGYPRKALTEMHRARCTLPAKVAHIVQKQPQLVSSAVQTFHYRDMQDMKAAAKLACFPPQVHTVCSYCHVLGAACLSGHLAATYRSSCTSCLHWQYLCISTVTPALISICTLMIGRMSCVSLQDLVTVIVTFNRALYAQLAQQQFQPPRGYPLPPLNSPAFPAAELGMKLTCGFEMVMAKSPSGAVPCHPRPVCLCQSFIIAHLCLTPCLKPD